MIKTLLNITAAALSTFAAVALFASPAVAGNLNDTQDSMPAEIQGVWCNAGQRETTVVFSRGECKNKKDGASVRYGAYSRIVQIGREAPAECRLDEAEEHIGRQPGWFLRFTCSKTMRFEEFVYQMPKARIGVQFQALLEGEAK
jgi:hypothetical protein